MLLGVRLVLAVATGLFAAEAVDVSGRADAAKASAGGEIERNDDSRAPHRRAETGFPVGDRSHPGVRNGHRLAYDAAGGTTLLFGGADERHVRGDLWAWDGVHWEQVDGGAAELARTFPAMAYDVRRRRLVVFGGNAVLFGSPGAAPPLLSDTWEWDGGRWHRFAGAGPSARAEAAMVFDAQRGRCVLFGGYRKEGEATVRLGDTWEFDGQSWRQVATDGPEPRSGAALAYDATRGSVVLFGGSGRKADTWSWQGGKWTRLETNAVEGRFNAEMAGDARRGLLLRFGGWDGRLRVAETWELIGTRWRRLDADGPEARNHSALSYDSARDRFVLFGGHDGERVFGDTWEWDGLTWRLAAPGGKVDRIDNGH